jgi:glycerol-3-phosphate cytidylyltransferase
MPEIVVVTFGTFDLFHVGHLRILQRARELGDILHVGVSSDAFTMHKKQDRAPVIGEGQRMDIVRAVRHVNGTVFLEESMEAKARYLEQHRATVLVMGDDWRGKFDDLVDKVSSLVRVVYLPRTPDVSTSEIIDTIITAARE